jgi:large subunit ribosomal protein L24
MKFKVGDQVLITAGKDKGRKGEITKVLPKDGKVVVRGINLYTKHIKPFMGQSGDRKVLERPLHTAKIAILNDKGGADRVGYQVNKDGSKTRIFKKTGKPVTAPKKEAKKK